MSRSSCAEEERRRLEKEKGNKGKWEVGWGIDRNLEEQEGGPMPIEGSSRGERNTRWVRGGNLRSTTRGTKREGKGKRPEIRGMDGLEEEILGARQEAQTWTVKTPGYFILGCDGTGAWQISRGSSRIACAFAVSLRFACFS